MTRGQSTHHRSRRSVLRLCGTAVGVAAGVGTATANTGSTGSSDAVTDTVPEDAYTVRTSPTKFHPAVLTVPAGETVTWEATLISHTVTSSATTQDAVRGNHNGDDEDAFTFDQPLFPGGPVQLTFEDPGRYPYFCRPHVELGMVGEVVVV